MHHLKGYAARPGGMKDPSISMPVLADKKSRLVHFLISLPAPIVRFEGFLFHKNFIPYCQKRFRSEKSCQRSPTLFSLHKSSQRESNPFARPEKSLQSPGRDEVPVSIRPTSRRVGVRASGSLCLFCSNRQFRGRRFYNQSRSALDSC